LTDTAPPVDGVSSISCAPALAPESRNTIARGNGLQRRISLDMSNLAGWSRSIRLPGASHPCPPQCADANVSCAETGVQRSNRRAPGIVKSLMRRVDAMPPSLRLEA